MEQQTPETKMAPKKKVDFPTEQFLRSVKHWTDTFISGEIKVGIFMNSIQDDAFRYCQSKNRLEEWAEFMEDYTSVNNDDYEEESSGEVIDVDE